MYREFLKAKDDFLAAASRTYESRIQTGTGGNLSVRIPGTDLMIVKPSGFSYGQCSEITDIIFTHLHWDHVYYLDRFVNADLHVQRTEYQFAVNPIPLYYKSYEYPVLGLKPQFDGRSFKLYDGEAEIFDGISVYPTPGHSVGHQTVVVNTSEGQYHCCGDLIFTYDNLKPVPEMHYDITPPGRFLDIVDEWNSIVELKKRAKSQEFILPTHAPEMIEIVDSKRVYGN